MISSDRVHAKRFLNMIFTLIDAHKGGAVNHNLRTTGQQDFPHCAGVRTIGIFMRDWNDIEAVGPTQHIYQIASELSGAAKDGHALGFHRNDLANGKVCNALGLLPHSPVLPHR